jgi:uncharacterized protein (DUF1778 family)
MAARPNRKPDKSRSLMVRMDESSKAVLARAAELRGISVSDYVRAVTVAQARKEVSAAGEQIISLTPDEQLAFWTALCEPVKLTAAQKKLGALMRGES